MADFIILDESIILPVKNVFATDSASLNEIQRIALVSADSSLLSEFSFYQAAFARTELGSLVEFIENIQNSSLDSFVFNDLASYEASVASFDDEVNLGEVALYETSLSSSDSSSFEDASGFDADSPAQDEISASDFASLVVQALSSDSSSLSDSTLGIIVSVLDSISFSESNLSNALSSLDSSTLAENIIISTNIVGSDNFDELETSILNAFFDLEDSFIISESSSYQADAFVTDDGSLNENVSISLSSFDSATLNETSFYEASVASFEEETTFSEFAFYETTLSSQDSSSLGDSSGFNADSPAQDSFSASDFPFIEIQALSADVSNLSESVFNILVAISDNFSFSESKDLSNIFLDLDSAILAESVFSSVDLETSDDNFNQEEFANVEASVSSEDSTLLYEFVDLNIAYESFDTGAFSEFVSNALANQDEGLFEENVLGISLNNAEFIFIEEVAQYQATLGSDDNTEFNEVSEFVDAGLPAVDSGIVSEFPSVIASLFSADALSLLEKTPSLEVSISEQFTLSEDEIFISLSTLESSELEESSFISSESSVNDFIIVFDNASVSALADSSDSATLFEPTSSVSADALSSDSSILYENVFTDVFISEEFDFKEFVSIALAAFDALILSEAGLVSTEHLSEDSFFIFDKADGLSVDQINDSGSLQEIIDFINIIGIQDSSTLDEFLFIETILSASDEQYQLNEQSSFEADSPAIDSGSLNDNSLIDAFVTSDESGLLQEGTPFIEFKFFDQFNFDENVANALVTEDLLILDELTFADVNAIAVEFANLVENASILTLANVNDQFFFTDIGQKGALTASTDSSSLFEHNLGVVVSISDSGIFSEFVVIEVSVQDYIQFEERAANSLISNDFVSAEDFSNLGANIVSEDLINFEEFDLSIFLNSFDASIVEEKPLIEADILEIQDLFIFTESQANASVLKITKDNIFFVESPTQISLAGYQLITYKERTGIWKRAPIVIDLNDEPTVHGTVTGNPVTIDITDATVPTILL